MSTRRLSCSSLNCLRQCRDRRCVVLLGASRRPEAIGPLPLSGLCQVYTDTEAGREFVRQACEIAEAVGLADVARCALLPGDCEAASTILAAAGTEIELSFRTPGHY